MVFKKEIQALRAALAEHERATRLAQQAAGTHPAPCAGSCEAAAFRAEIRALTAERDALKAEQAKPLTDEQILAMVKAAPALDTAEAEWLHVARAIERAHGIGHASE